MRVATLQASACLAAGSVLAVASSAQGVGADPGGEPHRTVILSNEEFEHWYGPAASKGEDGAIMSQEQFDRAADRQRVAYSNALATEPTGQAQALRASDWSTVKFKAKDLNGKTIPTRVGNSALGWRHFSKTHNITNANVIKLITEGSHTPKADPGRPHRLVYDGVLSTTSGPLDGPPKVLARIRIIAQYHWQTEKADYVLKNKHDKIGVITAYCRNVAKNRCPDKVNK